MRRILVLCTHNSARSQMAEGWLRQLCKQTNVEAEVWSAGTKKTRVKPEVMEVMGEVQIDLAQQWSKTMEELPYPESFDCLRFGQRDLSARQKRISISASTRALANRPA